MDTNREFVITIGKLLVLLGLAVTIPVIVGGLLYATGHPISGEKEKWLLTVSAFGFACVCTGSGAFIGSTVVTSEKHRLILFIMWIFQLGGVIFIGATYLLMISSHPDKILSDVLPELWMRSVYFIVVIGVPDLGVVGVLVCIRDLVEENEKVKMLDEQLEEKSLEASRLRMETVKLKESVRLMGEEKNAEIRRKVKEEVREASVGLVEVYRDLFKEGS